MKYVPMFMAQPEMQETDWFTSFTALSIKNEMEDEFFLLLNDGITFCRYLNIPKPI